MPPLVPAGRHTLTPYLVVDDALRAIEFYKNAFGAQILYVMSAPDDRIRHAELKIGDSVLFLADEMPSRKYLGPRKFGGTAVTLQVFVEDVDAATARAQRAGATLDDPPADMFFGERMSRITDPFGHRWCLATIKEHLTYEELDRRACAFWAKQGG